MNSAFFRDIVLRRQTRLNQTHENGRKPIPAKTRSVSTGSFNIVLKEELGSMDFNAPTPTTRAQRRLALSSIPRELKTALEDISEEASPPKLFNMPLPPLPTPSPPSRSRKSSPLLSSSPPSSPDSHKATLPLTPSSSVDELPLPPPAMKLKRLATVKPLVINKLNRPAVARPEDSDSEDSDSEWYTREFSSLLSVHSSSQPMPLPAAHRDSIFVAPSDSPFSPLSASFLGRHQRKFSGVHDPPPPVPPIPPQFRSATCNKSLSIIAPRRPPPRTSIPDDACSVFSLSIYTDDIVDVERSPLSIYSPDFARMTVRKDVDEDVEFPEEFDVQVDYPVMLPFSFPCSPIDPEADIAPGLEDLSLQKESVLPTSPLMTGLGVGFLLEESGYGGQTGLGPHAVTPRISFTSPPPSPTAQVSRSPPPPSAIAMTSAIPPPRPRRCSTISNLSSISFPPSPSIPHHDLPAAECVVQDDDFDERKLGLKSKWSSSSISSLHEGHMSSPKFPSASKLKMYFQGQHKRGTNISTLSSFVSTKSSRSSSPTKGKRKSKKETKKGKRGSDMPERDVLVIGYNNIPSPRPSFHYSPFSPPTSPRSSDDRTLVASPRHSPNMLDLPHTLPAPSLSSRYHGHVKCPSQGSAISDTGSDSSCISVASHLSNSNGTGLRRKPIPLDIFGKNGA